MEMFENHLESSRVLLWQVKSEKRSQNPILDLYRSSATSTCGSTCRPHVERMWGCFLLTLTYAHRIRSYISGAVCTSVQESARFVALSAKRSEATQIRCCPVEANSGRRSVRFYGRSVKRVEA
ncbi:hypothetical protein HAX54_018110 [Datura stramonium]|uniref:Uncharacterized protein n=1 Tax=Datura stramonium TaxID=4076 RepID=A0ABS8UME0_DATST|nr:hypothetical protein [Datura stramonium]